MILTYANCIEKAISEGKIYRIEPGLYSTEKYVSDVQIILQKYPNAILTREFPKSKMINKGLTQQLT